MNLKDLFASAEGGKLSFDELMAAAGESKFVDLTEGNYVSKQKYTDELAARDTRISSLDATIKTRDTDLAALQQKLSEAGTDATKLTELSGQFTELQGKYDKDTKALQKQLRDQAYKHAVNDFANQHEFTSSAAKRDFVQSMLAKNLALENETLIGATEFVTAYKQDNADAFKVASSEPPKAQPHFVEPTSQQSGGGGEPDTPFHFTFSGVRPH